MNVSKRFGIVAVVTILVIATNALLAAGFSENTTTSAYGYDSYDYNVNTTTTETGSGDFSGENTDDEDDEYVFEYTPVDYDPTIYEDKLNKKFKNSIFKSGWFSCDTNRKTISKDKVCNGIRDCHDCSDEQNCTSTSRNFFYCYGKGNPPSTVPFFYSDFNPMCIPRFQFCDGQPDCLNGADEIQTGPGFKCAVKDQFRTCLLPEDMVCDDYQDCEDRSDSCSELPNPTTPVTDFKAAGNTQRKFFRCLGGTTTVFQHQVCDDIIDCPDMSDECLCRHPGSPAVNKLCESFCWNQIWKDSGASGRSCKQCDIGETLSLLGIDQDTFAGSDTEQNLTCVKPVDVCLTGVKDHRDVCEPKSEPPDAFVKCLSLDGSFRTINARMCDARPECFFGEDECVPACNATNNLFCQLLVPDYGFRCGNQSADGVLGDRTTVRPCDGEPQCANSTDEMYCPTRLPCLLDDSEGSTDISSHMHTFDILQLCDGHADCQNKADELPSVCGVKRDTPCDVKGDKPCEEKSSDCPTFQDFYGSDDPSFKWHLNVENEPSDNVILQYGILVLSACAVVGNLYGLTVALINSLYILRRERSCLVTFLRESVMFTSIATAKMMLCACFAYTLLRSSKTQTQSCLENLEWRISSPCQISGIMTLISVTLPWIILTCFASMISCRREIATRKSMSKSPSVRFVSKTASCLLTLLMWILCWAPLAFIAVTVTSRGESHAWVKTNALADNLFGNIIDQTSARIFSERVITMSGNITPTELSLFTWSKFADVISDKAPSLGFSIIGEFGYYSLSEFCLPMFFARPTFNQSTWSMFSFCFVVITCVLSLYVTARIVYALVIPKRSDENEFNLSQASTTLSSIAHFSVAEILTWTPIIVMYFVKLMWPNAVSDVVYQGVVVALFSLNSGVACVYIHVRKRRIRFQVCSPDEVEADTTVAFAAKPETFVHKISDISEEFPLREASIS